MKRTIPVIILAIIILGAALIRCIGLGSNPVGFSDDEADKGYDAYSLLLTGKDQWGTPWPIFSFKGFGDYRAPMYTYLTVPSVKLFGLTPFAVRLPSALLGTLSVLAVFFLVSELFRGSKHATALSLTSAALLTISSWPIGMSRMAMEVVVADFLVIAGLYVFLVARRNHHLLPVAGLILGLSVYAYTADVVFVPLVLAVLIYMYRDTYVKKIRRWTIAAIVIFLLMTVLITISGHASSSVRLGQVNLTHDTGRIDLLNEKLGACAAQLPSYICRVSLNKFVVFFEKFVDNYIHHFSPSLLGISGTSTQYSALPGGGLLYLVTLPLFLLGIYTSFRAKNRAGMFMTMFLLLSAIPDSLTSDGHYTRFFISVPGWQIVTGVGILRLWEWKKIRWFILTAVAFLYIAALFRFVVEYTTYFPYRYSAYSHYGYKELVSDIETYKSRYDKIIISSRANDAKQYIFYLFYTKYDPVQFQKGVGIEKGLDALGWVRVRRVGSVYFVSDLPVVKAQTVITDRELFIGAPSEFPAEEYIPSRFVVKDKKGDVLFEAVDAEDYVRCLRMICRAGE